MIAIIPLRNIRLVLRTSVFRTLTPSVLALSGCTQRTPMEAFDRFAVALEQGDRATVMDSLTPESAKILDGLVGIDTGSGMFPMTGLSEQTRAVEVAGGDGVRTTALVVQPSGQQAPPAIVFMTQVDGEWRVDMIATELKWNADWQLSGSETPPPPTWNDSPALPGE